MFIGILVHYEFYRNRAKMLRDLVRSAQCYDVIIRLCHDLTRN